MGEMSPELPPNCPPEGHDEPDGEYYRYAPGHLGVGDDLPDEDWVLPVNKRGPHFGHTDDCAAHALRLAEPGLSTEPSRPANATSSRTAFSTSSSETSSVGVWM